MKGFMDNSIVSEAIARRINKSLESIEGIGKENGVGTFTAAAIAAAVTEEVIPSPSKDNSQLVLDNIDIDDLLKDILDNDDKNNANILDPPDADDGDGESSDEISEARFESHSDSSGGDSSQDSGDHLLISNSSLLHSRSLEIEPIPTAAHPQPPKPQSTSSKPNAPNNARPSCTAVSLNSVMNSSSNRTKETTKGIDSIVNSNFHSAPNHDVEVEVEVEVADEEIDDFLDELYDDTE